MKLDGTLLVVKDMERARRFYQDVLFRKVTLDLGVYVVFEGGLCLMTEGQWTDLLGPPARDYTYAGNVCELSFEDDDIDAFLVHLQGFPDIEICTPFAEYPWGQRCIRFYDPDKHIVELGESMMIVVKRFLLSGLSVEETMKRSMFPREFVLLCRKELDEGAA